MRLLKFIDVYLMSIPALGAPEANRLMGVVRDQPFCKTIKDKTSLMYCLLQIKERGRASKEDLIQLHEFVPHITNKIFPVWCNEVNITYEMLIEVLENE